MGRKLRRFAIRALQWTVALGAFWYVIRGVDVEKRIAGLAGLDEVVILAILLITILEFGSRFSMWWVLLNGHEPTSFGTTARIDLVIKFINHLIPSKAAGHSIAPLVLRHYTDADWSDAVSIAGLNTGLYATLYGVTALVGVVLFVRDLPEWLVVVLLLSTGLYLVAGVLVMLAGRRLELAGRLFGRLEGVAGRVPRIGDRLAGLVGSLPSFSADSATTFRDLSSRPRVVISYAGGWAGTLMVFPGLRVWLLLVGLGGSFQPAILLPVVLVLAYSITILPVTPGGIGVAEASATAVLASLGVDPALAATVILVDRSLGVYLPAMLGWIPMANVDLMELLSRKR